MSHENVRYLRQNQTPAEQLLWAQLRKKRLGTRVRRQQAIGPFIVDFYCHAARLAIEIDGPDHDLKFAQDERRTAWLCRYGVSILRFTNEDVRTNLDGVLMMIRNAIDASSSLPQPLPEGGENVRGAP